MGGLWLLLQMYYRIMGYFRMSFIFELFEEEVFYENLTLRIIRNPQSIQIA